MSTAPHQTTAVRALFAAVVTMGVVLLAVSVTVVGYPGFDARWVLLVIAGMWFAGAAGRHLRIWLCSIAIASSLLALYVTGTPLTVHPSGGLIGANQDRVDDINAERARNTTEACEQTNARHDATVASVRAQITSPASRRTTIALVDALAPVRDCAALTRDRVRSAP